MSPTAVQAPKKILNPWILLGFLWVTYFLNYVDRQVVFSVFPALRSEMSFTSTQLGLIGSVFTWVYSICMPISGRLADLFPRKHLIFGSLILWSLATWGTATSHSVGELLSWRAVMGVVESMYVPAALGLMATLFSEADRSKAFAIHATAQFAGVAGGGWFGGFMGDHAGWREAFRLLGACGLAYGVVLYFAMRKSASTQPSVNTSAPSAPGDVLRSSCFVALTLAFFAFAMLIWMLYAWLPSYLYDRFALSMTESGFTATVYLQVSSAIGVMGGGVLADKWSRRFSGARLTLSAMGLIVSAPFAWLIFSSSSLLVVKCAAIGFGLTGGVYLAAYIAAAYEVISARNYGLAAGILNLSSGMAGGIGIFLTGRLKESFGIGNLTLCASTATVIGGIVLLWMVRNRFPQEHARVKGV